MQKLLFTLLALVVSFPSVSWAKDKNEFPAIEGCPVQVTELIADDRTRGLYGLWYNYTVVKYRNISGKTIIGLKDEITYYDATGDPHKAYAPFVFNEKTKPGKVERVAFENYPYTAFIGRGIEVTFIKVMFEDGTLWEPDPERPCTWKYTWK